MIKIIRANIVDLDVDAIVNAANSTLLGGGGVDGAIHKAAGESLKEACKAFNGCKTGEAVITPGFNLISRHVIHTVGPIYFDHDEDESRELLSSCYLNSLTLAKNNDLHSIAFPCISSGVYGYPIEESSLVAISSVRKWLKKHKYEIDVYFVCFSDKDYDVYLKRLPVVSEDLTSSIDLYLNTNYKKRKVNNKKAKERILENVFPKTLSSKPLSENVDLVCSIEPCGLGLEDRFKSLDESFSEMVLRKIDEKGISDATCYKKANIDRRLFSKIRSDIYYRPTKQTALALGIALELPLIEIEDLLKKAGFALSDSNKFDVIVKYFIENENYDISLIDEVLLKYDQKTITNY